MESISMTETSARTVVPVQEHMGWDFEDVQILVHWRNNSAPVQRGELTSCALHIVLFSSHRSRDVIVTFG